SSGEMTQVSHPVTAWAASRTSSSIARARAPRSRGVSSGATRRLAPASDFTGTAMTRIVQGYRESTGPGVTAGAAPQGVRLARDGGERGHLGPARAPRLARPRAA